MTLRRWWRGAPLFLQIFGWMLAGVAVMQICSAVLIFVLPRPEPRLFTVEQIAAALQTNHVDTAELRLTDDDDDDIGPQEPLFPAAVDLRILLAQRLGVAVERVRLHHDGPPRFDPVPMLPMPGAPRGAPGPQQDPRRQLFFGNFSASLLLPDGHWRTVAPSQNGSYEFWRWRALAWLLGALIAIAPIAWMLARRLARPIAMFAKAADRLGRDPRAAPIPLQGPPEVAEAAAAFNQMQARLSRYVEDRAMLTAAIAHDLRTPLMRLSLRLEQAPEALREQTASDIRDMESMISSVLSFLRDLSTPARRNALDLRSLAESVTDGFADQGRTVTLLPGESLVLEGDPQALKALFANLIGNALAYGGGAAEVAIGRDGDAWIEVRDHGPGIPEDQLDRVFEPFYRVEQSRNRETGGTGLGLASVRAVARAHGGEAVLINRASGGLIARVTLPL